MDYYCFEEIGIELQQLKKDIANLVEFYNEIPIISDNFKDHVKRQVWQEEIGKQYGKQMFHFIKNNKLSINMLHVLFEIFSIYEAEIDNRQITSQKVEKIKSLITRFEPLSNHKYYDFTKEKKLEFVHEVENIIKDFIKLLQIQEKK